VTLAFKPGQSEAAGATFVTEEFSPTLQAQNNGSTAVPAVMAYGFQPRAIFTGDGAIADPIGANEASTYTNEGSGNFRLHNCVGEPPAMTVRRLTPVECERLQGFPDDYTRIPWKKKTAEECPDGPRYKALGNSMACNVMRWIGRRIEVVEACDAR
jgi:DNA (cytosine-5)-methyltransferase 1